MPASHDDVNQELWNQRTQLHIGSGFYQEDQFLEGYTTLNPLELELLGDLRGKRLLHLQCHFGLDTLSLAREGAIVTGVDYSDLAIAHAIELCKRTGLAASFICSNIYDLPNVLGGTFDIVFASYGFLQWLSDLARWARIAMSYLGPLGSLTVVEFHPLRGLFDPTGEFDPRFVYSSDGQALRRTVTGSYVDRSQRAFEREAWTWRYGIGEVATALASAGFVIEALHEHMYTYSWGKTEHRVDPPVSLPLLFSIQAHAPNG